MARRNGSGVEVRRPAGVALSETTSLVEGNAAAGATMTEPHLHLIFLPANSLFQR